MPPLGEAPITSFFRVNPQSKKRRDACSDSRITKKQRNEREDSVPSSSKKRIDEHFPVSSSSLNSKPHIPRTPVHKNSRVDRGNAVRIKQLETPPLTNSIPRLLRSNAPRPAESSSSLAATEITTTPFLPSPVTIPRRKPIKNIPHNIDNTPKPQLSESRNPPSLDIGTEGSELFVPSSQSQPELSFVSNDTTAMQSPPRIAKIVGTSSRNNQFMVRPGIQDLETNVEDDDLVIPSSQSQPPLAMDKSPTKFARHPIQPLRSPSKSEYIPSSQSQEIDLVIRSDDEDTPLPNLTKTPYPVRNSPIKSTGNLSRTLSDVLFPVPIQHFLFDDIFHDGDAITSQQNESIIPNPNNAVEEESVTESESEYEWTAKPTAKPSERMPKDAPSLSSITLPKHCSQDSAADDEHESQSPITHSIGSTSEGTLTILSQPLAVKDFENMFVDCDESYPPDFPMSLRS